MANAKDSNTATKPAELRAPAHKRAKLVANLKGTPLVDLISDAADKVTRPFLKRRGLGDDCEPVSRGQ